MEKMSTMSIFIGFYANHGYFVEVEENFRYKKIFFSQIMPYHSTTPSETPTSPAWHHQHWGIVYTEQVSSSLRNYKGCFLNSPVAGGLTCCVSRSGLTLQCCFRERYEEHWEHRLRRDLKLGDLKLIRCQMGRALGRWDHKRLRSPKESKMNLTCRDWGAGPWHQDAETKKPTSVKTSTK